MLDLAKLVINGNEFYVRDLEIHFPTANGQTQPLPATSSVTVTCTADISSEGNELLKRLAAHHHALLRHANN